MGNEGNRFNAKNGDGEASIGQKNNEKNEIKQKRPLSENIMVSPSYAMTIYSLLRAQNTNFKSLEEYFRLVLDHIKNPSSTTLHLYTKDRLIHSFTAKVKDENGSEERDYVFRDYEEMDSKQKKLVAPQLAAIEGKDMNFIFIDRNQMFVYNTKVGDHEPEDVIEIPIDTKKQKIISPIYTKSFYSDEARKLGVWTITGEEVTLRDSNLAGYEAIKEVMLFISTLSSGVSRIVENFDPLTNLPTRIAMDEQLKAAIALYNSGKIDDFSVIMFDIDGFKRINDTYGHPTGDEVLKMLSYKISESIRKKRAPNDNQEFYPDFLARWGGEEFLHLIISNIEAAKQCALRFMKIVRDINIPLPVGGHLKISCTFGAASIKSILNNKKTLTYEDVELLVKKADEQLYRGKNSGKDCICIEGSEPIRN